MNKSHYRNNGHITITMFQDEISNPCVEHYDTSVSNLLQNITRVREPQYSGDIVDMSRLSLLDQKQLLEREVLQVQNLKLKVQKEKDDLDYLESYNQQLQLNSSNLQKSE